MKRSKSTKQVIRDAIIKGIEQGRATDKLCAVICRKFQFSERTFYNHLKIAQQQYSETQQSLKEQLAAIDTAAAIEARKRAIMTAGERKEYLTKIILGEVEVPYTEVKWDKVQNKFVTIKFVELAGHSARISAIAELNKMSGDYAPDKIAQTDTYGNDIPPQKPYSKEELISILKAANE